MSILTQVRQTIVTQRCMSAASWRFDVRDGYGYFPHYQYNIINNANIHAITDSVQRSLETSNSVIKLTPGKRHIITHYKGRTYKIEASNTPKNNQIENSVLDRKYIKELNKDANLSSLLQKESQLPDHNSRMNYLTLDKALLFQIFEKIRLTFKSEHRIYPTFNGLRQLTRHKSSLIACEHGGNRQSHGGEYQDNAFKNKYPPALIPIVAILGLFEANSDSEGEKEKLTDKQKMKKMKPVELIIARGVLAMTDQEHGRASQLFHDALRLAQDEMDQDRESLILNLLATNYYEGGDFENAEKLFIDIMRRLIALDIEPTDPAILELSLKLASIYSKNKATHEKALKGFKFVINSLLNRLYDTLNNVEEVNLQDLSEDKRGELALLGWSYDWFAKHLIAVNDFKGAVEMLKKALQISLKVLGPLHQQTLILLNDVGTTLAMIDEPDEGKEFIKRAVEGAIESKSKELASFYVNLGLVNLKLKKFNEAKRYCEYSIELALKNREHHNSSDVITLSQKCLNEVEQLLKVDN